MIVVTGGTGYFLVDKRMTLLTKRKLIDHGIGCDMVCMAGRPIHRVALFRYISGHEGTLGVLPRTDSGENGVEEEGIGST